MTKNDGTDFSSTPRWVKVQGALVILFVLLVVAMASGSILGGHGGGGHAPRDHHQSMGGD